MRTPLCSLSYHLCFALFDLRIADRDQIGVAAVSVPELLGLDGEARSHYVKHGLDGFAGWDDASVVVRAAECSPVVPGSVALCLVMNVRGRPG